MELQLLGQKPIFPEITHFQYLLDILYDMNFGVYSDGLLLSELESYCRMNDISLSNFEIKSLTRLSYDYINMLRLAKDKDCEQPYKLDKI